MVSTLVKYGEKGIGSKDLGNFRIREAVEEDVPLILQFIKKLAHYERLSHEVIATEETSAGKSVRREKGGGSHPG